MWLRYIVYKPIGGVKLICSLGAIFWQKSIEILLSAVGATLFLFI